MVGASKILTVSYGTFSCTLEGFEEPFSTMKAIAEYFRDLAADDRYFGAEPPTPDAEMLHRIAEREIQRRVEAKISEHGIVLRAETEAAAEQVAPAASAATSAAAVMVGAAAPAAAAAPVSAAEPEAALAATEELTEEVAEDIAEAIAAEEPAAEDVFGEDTLVEDLPEEEVEAAPAMAASVAVEKEETDSESVAAKLMRIRAVVAAAQAAPAAAFDAPSAEETAFEAQTFEEPAFEEEEAAADFAPASTAPAGDFGFELDFDDFPAARPAAKVDAEETSIPTAEAVEETDDAAAYEDEVEDDEALSMIGELVEEETGEEISETEFLAEAFDAEEEDRHVAEAMAEELGAEEETAEEAEEDVAGAFGEYEEDEEDAFEEMAEVETEVEEEEEAAAAAAPEGALDLAAWRMDVEEEDLDAAEDFAEDEMEDVAEIEDEAEAETAEDEAAVAMEAAAEVEMEPQAEAKEEAAETKPGFFERARARVIKIRRAPAAEEALEAAEAEEAVADDMSYDEDEAWDELHAEADDLTAEEIETDDDSDERRAAIFAALSEEIAIEAEYDDLEEPEAEEDDAALLAGIGAAIGETGLDPDAEEDLLRELAEVARDSRRDSHEGRAILESNAGDGEASVERLMEEAKSKLEGDESRRRFSAISHLKAAVAATVADRKLKSRDAPVTEAGEAAEEIERYRDDLSKAVRPRRPAAEAAPTTRRPTIEARPSPLVLVSEQRIDSPAGPRPESAVVRPRRISAGNLAVSDDSDQDDDTDVSLSPEEAKNFAEFAERLGAVNLSDMLEAAAAYTATVEGQPHFSRPQILKKIANVADDEEYSREDGLRSFGMLLRQGKIQKISRGQFTITESSRFMSEARRAAR